ncbi:MAG: hypothetical protein BWX84_00162 [Verrucomicrobia bacterium ADurb.Bin118]|nr:MAG: hypothetical protein BWX84_00162 [Verrucomicrobia bacterium ADurb.Bin118]
MLQRVRHEDSTLFRLPETALRNGVHTTMRNQDSRGLPALRVNGAQGDAARSFAFAGHVSARICAQLSRAAYGSQALVTPQQNRPLFPAVLPELPGQASLEFTLSGKFVLPMPCQVRWYRPILGITGQEKPATLKVGQSLTRDAFLQKLLPIHNDSEVVRD